MDPLDGLFVNEFLEEDDERVERRFQTDLFDPFEELTDQQFRQLFRLSKQLVNRLIEILTPHFADPIRNPRRITIQKKVCCT